jgi:hypothetical protein
MFCVSSDPPLFDLGDRQHKDAMPLRLFDYKISFDKKLVNWNRNRFCGNQPLILIQKICQRFVQRARISNRSID